VLTQADCSGLGAVNGDPTSPCLGQQSSRSRVATAGASTSLIARQTGPGAARLPPGIARESQPTGRDHPWPLCQGFVTPMLRLNIHVC